MPAFARGDADERTSSLGTPLDGVVRGDDIVLASDGARAVMTERRGRTQDCQGNLAAQKIGNNLRGPPVWHMVQADRGSHLQQFHRKMMDGSDARCGIAERLATLGRCRHVFQRSKRRIGANRDRERRSGHRTHRGKTGAGIQTRFLHRPGSNQKR
jgi:hypothetical protein